MTIEGMWFMQPGDLPADFVFHLELHADGRAIWVGGKTLVERYGVLNGKLTIGEGAQRMVFSLPNEGDDPNFLSGHILTEYEPDPDDDDDGPSVLTDAAVLLRDAGDLEVVDYARAAMR